MNGATGLTWGTTHNALSQIQGIYHRQYGDIPKRAIGTISLLAFTLFAALNKLDVSHSFAIPATLFLGGTLYFSCRPLYGIYKRVSAHTVLCDLAEQYKNNRDALIPPNLLPRIVPCFDRPSLHWILGSMNQEQREITRKLVGDQAFSHALQFCNSKPA